MVRVWEGIKQRQLFMPKEILIVDDEPGIVVPIQFLMEQQGYKVMIAERGEDALDLIYQYKAPKKINCSEQ
jgi:CheY-like chemotaxis protein